MSEVCGIDTQIQVEKYLSNVNKFKLKSILFCTLGLLVGACSTPRPVREPQSVQPTPKPTKIRGLSSWYGKKFARRKTANGERFNMNAFTAAHRTLPFGTRVRVSNVKSGKSVVVRINDRGPFKKNRLIDVSYAAGSALGMLKDGVALVEIEVLSH